MYQVFQMTRRYDSTAIWWFLLAFLGPVLAGVYVYYFGFRKFEAPADS